MDIVYRVAQANDAEALLLHLECVGGETDYLSFGKDTFKISVEKEARFIEKFYNSKKDVMFVAMDGERVVGNASLVRNRIDRYSHRAELSITVLRDYWGRGIGNRLMQLMIDFAKETKCEIIYLETRSDNVSAISLYKKFGFEKIGVYNNFFKINGEYFNADLMVLYL